MAKLNDALGVKEGSTKNVFEHIADLRERADKAERKVLELSDVKRRYRWQLTRINQGYQMTKVKGNAIACRPLTLWEKIKYFRKMK